MKILILSNIQSLEQFEVELISKLDPPNYVVDRMTHREIRNSGIHFIYNGFLNVGLEKIDEGYILNVDVNNNDYIKLKHLMPFISRLINIFPDCQYYN